MRRLTQFLARLYPPAWRTRYGPEFDALLDDSNPTPRAALNVLTGAFAMHIRTTRKIVFAALLAAAAIAVASWYAGQHPYISPGSNQVLRQDSNLGALITLPVMLVAFLMFLTSAALLVCGKFRRALKTFLASIAGLAIYSLAVILVSVLTPRTIVSVGDGYCYDLLCIGVQKVDAAPQGQSVVYNAQIRLFSDADHVQTSTHGASIYVLDERGRRFPLSPLGDVTLSPGESVSTQLTFAAPADSRQLFLTKDSGVLPPWVFLYLGSDISPFHRRTLLRML